MFDVGFSELVLMAVVALVVLGPEKLPHAARVAGAWVARIRRTVGNMQAEIEREVSAQEMRERLKKEIEAVRDAGAAMDIRQPLQVMTTSVQELQAEIQSTLPPAASIGTPIDLSTDTSRNPASPELPVPVDLLGPDAAPAVATPAVASADATLPTADGDAAYREWLASRQNANLKSSAPDSDSTPS